MKGRGLTLLRLGHRCGRGAGADGVMHRLAVGTAAVFVVLTAWLFVAAHTVYQQRDARMAARAPRMAAALDAPDAATWWNEGTDTDHDRQFTVVTIAPLRAGAPLPPGLPRWPEPGEAFLSAAMVAHDADGVLRARYGRFAGTIAEDGLSEPTEWLVYRRPAGAGAVTRFAEPGARQYQALAGFGTRQPWRFGVDGTDLPFAEVLRAMGVLALPTMALLVIAARTGSRLRDARLAMLDALGASTGARCQVLLGEAAVPAAAGSAVAAGIAAVTTLVDTRLPFSGYVVRCSDLATARWALPVVGIGGYALVLATVVATQAGRRPGVGSRPRATLDRVRHWPIGVAAVALAATTVGAQLGGPAGRLAYGLGMLAFLAALPGVATFATSWLGQVVADRGGAAGRPSWIVGGRWLAARPSVIARAGAVIIIGLGLVGQANVLQTQLTEVGRAAGSLRQLVGDTMVEFRPTIAAPGELEAYARRLDQSSADQSSPDRSGAERSGLLRVYHQAGPEDPGQPPWLRPVRTLVVGSRETLGRMGELTGTPDGPIALSSAYRRLGVEWTRLAEIGVLDVGRPDRPDAWRTSDRILVSTAEPNAPADTGQPMELDRLVLLNEDGRAGVDRIKKTAYGEMVAVNIAVVADDFQAAATEYARGVDWMLDGGLFAMVVLILAEAIGAAGAFVTQSRDLGPLSGFKVRRGFYHQIAFWNLTAPLLLVSVIGTAAAVLLAYLLTELAPLGTVSWPFTAACLLLACAAAVALGAGCGEIAVRTARTWRPSGE